ncbi:DUF6602 domain-containing protein [Virgibacillus chiguensis]|uniref:DUF6602 domain-containing protein n=1 Tax=Virgibacillus chiguensis TaxID=411959 RepID=A0A1M5T974_9BACI|nr:DUF6602 domain-containing protein [Virgibacillus chiguensis]SHH47279.1 hypothetical protein SAMN05421807_107159 [Virgibacillus chiguensis]
MNEEVITKLAKNYCNLEQTLIEELNIDRQSNVSSAEEIWQPVFRRIVPTKFNVEKNVYIIDSHQNVSQKVSLAIYDEQYTPYIFNYGTIKYIPIEAVAAVVLCENEKDKKRETEGQGAEETWLQSIQKLKTEMNAYVRIQSGVLDTNLESLYKKFEEEKRTYEKQKCSEKNCTVRKPQKQSQTSTRPITILCTAIDNNFEDSEFDLVLKNDESKLKKMIPNENRSLDKWSDCLNHYCHDRYENKDKLKALADTSEENKSNRTLESLNVGDQNVLLSLMFQLNQLLMLINNPIFFPHESYVKAFKEVISDAGTKKSK